MNNRNMSQPKVTIVIPVYNVEQYLRQCLDSVVNQTLREIQIICVNDGSSDGSRDILQEYANKDSRIEIIDKPNGGLSSARNAAYPHLKGKYTLFVDSDDWIDLDTCRKTYYRAEQAQADVVVFEIIFLDQKLIPVYTSNQATFFEVTTTKEKQKLFRHILPSVCLKLCRTSFLLENNIRCPLGFCSQDVAFTWKAVPLAQKIVSLPVVCYYYRAKRVGSIRNTHYLRNLQHIVEIFQIVWQSLEETNLYNDYSDSYHYWKLTHIHGNYSTIPCAKTQREAVESGGLGFLDRKRRGNKL